MPLLLHAVTNTTTTAQASATLGPDTIEGHNGEMCEVQEGGDYDAHECSTLPTKVEVKMASRVLKRLVQNKHCYVLEER